MSTTRSRRVAEDGSTNRSVKPRLTALAQATTDDPVASVGGCLGEAYQRGQIVRFPRLTAASIKGTPTWIIRGRWDAGESDSDIADDFGISPTEVREALKFERVPIGRAQSLAH